MSSGQYPRNCAHLHVIAVRYKWPCMSCDDVQAAAAPYPRAHGRSCVHSQCAASTSAGQQSRWCVSCYVSCTWLYDPSVAVRCDVAPRCLVLLEGQLQHGVELHTAHGRGTRCYTMLLCRTIGIIGYRCAQARTAGKGLHEALATAMHMTGRQVCQAPARAHCAEACLVPVVRGPGQSLRARLSPSATTLVYLRNACCWQCRPQRGDSPALLQLTCTATAAKA